jgi:hypothetical protein
MWLTKELVDVFEYATIYFKNLIAALSNLRSINLA